MGTLIERILGGSCCPATELAELVDSGDITLEEATTAYRRGSRAPVDLRAAARDEAEAMRRLDV